MSYQVGVLQSERSDASLKITDGSPWILKRYPKPSSTSLVRGSLQGGPHGAIWAVEEASSGNNTARWAPISAQKMKIPWLDDRVLQIQLTHPTGIPFFPQ